MTPTNLPALFNKQLALSPADSQADSFVAWFNLYMQIEGTAGSPTTARAK
jgi:hypothetical protein